MSPFIRFEDPHLLVLEKPSGLLTQGDSSGEDNVVDWLRTYLGRPYVGLIHRLDRNTSGLLVVAKRTKSASRLTQSLQSGELKRWYRAWIAGTLRSTEHWQHWLIKNEATNTVSVVSPDRAKLVRGAKLAELEATPIRHAVFEAQPLTLAEFSLQTGRTHQIRVQAAAQGHALLGDPKYTGARFSRLALHSYRLEFPHPMSRETLSYVSELPKELEL